jgi:uncharacterized protein (TIGR03435 family)
MKPRKHYTGEEKVAILRRHILEKEPISTLCDVRTPVKEVRVCWGRSMVNLSKEKEMDVQRHLSDIPRVGRVVASTTVASIVSLCGLPPAFSQMRDPARPAFEVASVKKGDPRGSIEGHASGRRLVWENFGLADMIVNAYHVGYWQLSKVPEWRERFTIDGLVPEGSVIRTYPLKDDRLMTMVQSLLEDRFKLRFHWETKAARGYALVVAKGGSKLRASVGEAPADPNERVGMTWVGGGKMSGVRASMTDLTRALAMTFECPVTDKTGLGGIYDFTFKYARTGDDVEPSLTAAMQEQLGLRLVREQGEARILVVDHAEKPEAN